jgi:hypothetical protein
MVAPFLMTGKLAAVAVFWANRNCIVPAFAATATWPRTWTKWFARLMVVLAQAVPEATMLQMTFAVAVL